MMIWWNNSPPRWAYELRKFDTGLVEIEGMLRYLLFILLATSATSVAPMMNMVRKTTYLKEVEALPCGICREAVQLQWNQSPSSVQEWMQDAEASCKLATRNDPPKAGLCIAALRKNAHTLMKTDTLHSKVKCFRTGSTDCDMITEWAVHCDHKKAARCKVMN